MQNGFVDLISLDMFQLLLADLLEPFDAFFSVIFYLLCYSYQSYFFPGGCLYKFKFIEKESGSCPVDEQRGTGDESSVEEDGRSHIF